MLDLGADAALEVLNGDDGDLVGRLEIGDLWGRRHVGEDEESSVGRESEECGDAGILLDIVLIVASFSFEPEELIIDEEDNIKLEVIAIGEDYLGVGDAGVADRETGLVEDLDNSGLYKHLKPVTSEEVDDTRRAIDSCMQEKTRRLFILILREEGDLVEKVAELSGVGDLLLRRRAERDFEMRIWGIEMLFDIRIDILDIRETLPHEKSDILESIALMLVGQRLDGYALLL